MIFFLDQYTIHNTASTIFEAVFDTTKTSTGSSDANSITLPISNMDGLSVDWGDGTINSLNTHTYASSGVKTVKIKGNISNWRFNNTGDRLKLTEIKSWGNFNITLNSAFYGCANLTLNNVIGIPTIISPSLSQLFRGCTSLTLVNNMNSWNVSNVNDMSTMFQGASNFNQNIGSWDVSSVINTAYMFQDASSFNQNIGGWNVSNVTDMWSMFQRATNFNQNISGWNVSNVTNMQSMFANATNFNQNIGSWNVSNVTNMNSMFSNATNFNQDISNWDIRNVSNFTNFMNAKTASNYTAAYLTSIYNKWSVLTPVKTGITISFGSIKYTSAGQAGRDILTTTYGWTITDGGI